MQLVQGYCNKHQLGKIDRNGETLCMLCDSETTPKTGIDSRVEDPGDAAVRDVLKKAGIAVPPNTGKAPMPDVPKPIRSHPAPVQAAGQEAIDTELNKKIAAVTLVSPKDSFASKVELALGIMRSLPMPGDVKQFKAIQKIIAGMEVLAGEK